MIVSSVIVPDRCSPCARYLMQLGAQYDDCPVVVLALISGVTTYPPLRNEVGLEWLERNKARVFNPDAADTLALAFNVMSCVG